MFTKPNFERMLAKYIDEVQNIESWKICEDHFEASGFVKDRLNIGCVPKPYEHSANEDFVLLEELLFSEDVESVVMQDETFVECSCHQGRSKGGGGQAGPAHPRIKVKQIKNKIHLQYLSIICLWFKICPTPAKNHCTPLHVIRLQHRLRLANV
jgi:hypothetical protein